MYRRPVPDKIDFLLGNAPLAPLSPHFVVLLRQSTFETRESTVQATRIDRHRAARSPLLLRANKILGIQCLDTFLKTKDKRKINRLAGK